MSEGPFNESGLFDLLSKIVGWVAIGFFSIVAWVGKSQIKRISDIEEDLKDTRENYVSKKTLQYVLDDLKKNMHINSQRIENSIIELRGTILTHLRDPNK